MTHSQRVTGVLYRGLLGYLHTRRFARGIEVLGFAPCVEPQESSADEHSASSEDLVTEGNNASVYVPFVIALSSYWFWGSLGVFAS
jgi:hypothetical protein